MVQDLAGGDFAYADLRGVQLAGGQLQGADFRGAPTCEGLMRAGPCSTWLTSLRLIVQQR